MLEGIYFCYWREVKEAAGVRETSKTNKQLDSVAKKLFSIKCICFVIFTLQIMWRGHKTGTCYNRKITLKKESCDFIVLQTFSAFLSRFFKQGGRRGA